METLEIRTMDFEYEYRGYLSKVDIDGRTVYYKPESPNALYTADALPKDAKITTVAPTKAPVKVTPSKNSTVDFYTKKVAEKDRIYKESVARDEASCKGMAISNPTSDKTLQAKSELNEAKKSLQYEIFAQSQVNK